jgi:hypothetical protein
MARGELTIELDQRDYQRAMALLQSLDKVDQHRIIQKALRTGMQDIIDAGKANLVQRNKTKTGNLKKSFGIRVNKKKGYAIGGHKRPAGAHSFLIDRGTKERWTRRGAYRGSVSRGNPQHGSMYWTDAVNKHGNKALGSLMNAIYQSLNEITRRNQ